ncbi:hypothetical protein GGR53DRAFT_532814 [Hypoxylon sp. FL1150]|nr:hypothetical protein GGR53DRAFT_532814 [Hypoxylon sp. FL1150]
MNGTVMIEEDRKGLLVPPWFVREDINDTDMNVGSMLFGATLSITIFVCSKGGKQTYESWKRTGRLTPYMVMIWLELAVSLGLAFLTWMYLRGYITASIWIFFFVLFFWSLQIQFILQIIINRLGLLEAVPGRVQRMKLMTALLITTINISVFCIWVPARLQISETYIRLNDVWDRVEKGIFACADLCLNLYFVYQIRSRLINNGLNKYLRVYRMNLVLVSISMILDVVLIAMMSLPNTFVYLLFHPVAYLFKLVIEMNMADLIVKVVKTTNTSTGMTLLGTDSQNQPIINLSRLKKKKQDRAPGQHRPVHVYAEERQNVDSDSVGILRTIETSVVRDDGSWRSSSPNVKSSVASASDSEKPTVYAG